MSDKKIVLITGCFDILHRGHIELFLFARENFSHMKINVLIDSDERVRKYKGNSRPINNERDRCEVLNAIKYIDNVEIFRTDEALIGMCREWNPIRLLGDDYVGKIIVGKEFCSSVVYFNKIKDLSTTNTIRKINEESSAVR